jgi:hypothetical protein
MLFGKWKRRQRDREGLAPAQEAIVVSLRQFLPNLWTDLLAVTREF